MKDAPGDWTLQFPNRNLKENATYIRENNPNPNQKFTQAAPDWVRRLYHQDSVSNTAKVAVYKVPKQLQL